MKIKSKEPVLFVNSDVCKNNIKRFTKKANENNVVFRPHFKTHQNNQIAEIFKENGVNKICVSSVQMAEKFSKTGFQDILIAFSFNALQNEDYNKLSKKVNLGLTIENSEHIDLINYKSDIYIKVDCSYNRTGIDVNNHKLILGIVNKINQNKKLSFKGFLSHFGDTYHAKSKNEIISIYNNAIDKLQKLKRKIPEAIISIGDTPSLSIVENLSNVDEIRPGNFVYNDLMQYELGSCNKNKIASLVSCPVVAKHKSRNEIVIYGGAVHLSKEHLKIDGKNVFGKIVLLDKGFNMDFMEGTYVKSLSQEHGIIKTTDEVFDKIIIGECVGVVEVHSCLTANLLQDNTVVL